MGFLKWLCYFIGAVFLIFGIGTLGDTAGDSAYVFSGFVQTGLGILFIWLGRRIEKKRREEQRKEAERYRAARPSRPYSDLYMDSGSGTGPAEPDYESSAFIRYPIGSYYGDLSDEDDERLKEYDPIERDHIIEQERIWWDLMMSDDDE